MKQPRDRIIVRFINDELESGFCGEILRRVRLERVLERCHRVQRPHHSFAHDAFRKGSLRPRQATIPVPVEVACNAEIQVLDSHFKFQGLVAGFQFDCLEQVDEISESEEA